MRYQLAHRAEVRWPSCDVLPHHHAPASWARLTVLLEDPQVILVYPGAAQHVPVQPHRCSSMLYPRHKVLTDRSVESIPLLHREGVGLPPGMHPSVIEDLVHINVADTRHDLLV